MNNSYNWGILGAGKIANKFAAGLKLLRNATLHSVGSRSAAKAADFAAKHGFSRSYGSYHDFAADPDLDIVYVATPHSHHLEHTLLCLDNGKHVICEKAFSLNGGEVDRMIAKAEERELFLMEALWPPFQPSYRAAVEHIKSGQLGELLFLRSNFAFHAPYSPEARIFNPQLGGGSLLDIGIYPVIDALMFMGLPSAIEASAGFTSSGVDHTVNIQFDYGDGRFASLYSSVNHPGGISAELFFRHGKIVISRSRELIQSCRVEKIGDEPVEYFFNPDGMGYQFEADEVMGCIDKGRLQSSVVPWSFSRDLIRTLDSIREKINLVYPGKR